MKSGLRGCKYTLESSEFLRFEIQEKTESYTSCKLRRPRCVEKLQNALEHSEGELNSSLREGKLDEQSGRPRVFVKPPREEGARPQ